MGGMGERFVQVMLLIVVVIVGVTILGWILKTLWWMAVIAGGIVLAGLVLGALKKDS